MQYIVTRHGSNSANQSMTPEAIVGTVEAENESAAKEAAREKFTVYNNQWVSVEPADEATGEDARTAWEADAAHEADVEAFRP